MSDDSCHHIEDAHAWALGILPVDRADEFLAHLKTCLVCQDELERAQRLLAAMADAVPSTTPPPELRARVMDAVRSETALSEAADEPLDKTQATARTRRVGPAALLAALAVGAIAATFAMINLIGDETNSRPDIPVRTTPGEVTAGGGGAAASAQVVTRGSASRLELARMAPPPRGQVYQVWVVRAGDKATPTGSLFSIPRSGRATVALPSLSDVEKVIVTAEAPRGSRTPTLPAVAEVPLPR